MKATVARQRLWQRPAPKTSAIMTQIIDGVYDLIGMNIKRMGRHHPVDQFCYRRFWT